MGDDGVVRRLFFYKFLGGKPDLEFVVPEEGGMLWATPLEIPLGAQHPTDAHLFVDWFYRPEIAVQVTDVRRPDVRGWAELFGEVVSS